MTRKEYLDRACEWLDNTLPNIEYITNASALRQNKRRYIEAFRKAMETCKPDKVWHKTSEGSEELPKTSIWVHRKNMRYPVILDYSPVLDRWLSVNDDTGYTEQGVREHFEYFMEIPQVEER